MKIASRGSWHSHFYRCSKYGKLVDKRELRDVIFHETDHKRNPHIPRIRGQPIQTRRRNDSPPDGFAVSIDASNLPKGALVLRAWNIDMAERNAFALAGSVNVQNGSDGPF